MTTHEGIKIKLGLGDRVTLIGGALGIVVTLISFLGFIFYLGGWTTHVNDAVDRIPAIENNIQTILTRLPADQSFSAMRHSQANITSSVSISSVK